MTGAAQLSGPALDKLKARLIKWYTERRQFLITEMTWDYPYGAEKVSASEQYGNWLSMAPEDYEALVATLNNKYRGLPNAYDLVNKDLAAFMSHMLGLMSVRSA